MTFSAVFIYYLVYGALALCCVNGIILLGLLAIEWKSKRLWK